jgi:hypothetical protein
MASESYIPGYRDVAVTFGSRLTTGVLALSLAPGSIDLWALLSRRRSHVFSMECNPQYSNTSFGMDLEKPWLEVAFTPRPRTSRTLRGRLGKRQQPTPAIPSCSGHSRHHAVCLYFIYEYSHPLSVDVWHISTGNKARSDTLQFPVF